MKLIGKEIALVMVALMVLFFGCSGGSGGGGHTPSAADSTLAPVNEDTEDDNGPGDDTPVNLLPVADAGVGQTLTLNTLATLDGSQSYDPDENYPLTFAWNIHVQPEGGTAVLSADGQFASFVIDRPGDYEIELTVTDQKGAVSAPVTVIISTLNSAPVADAGPNQLFQAAGASILLDGSQSYDPDNDAITYNWVLIKPESSAAVLTEETSAHPGFVADVLGTYTVELVVTDAYGRASAVDSAIITSDNVPPVANAGMYQVVFVGDTVVLDGSGSSDANNDILTYQWNISVKPDGSTAELSDADQASSYFVPDLQGIYTAVLVVRDDFSTSDPSALNVLALDAASLDAFIRPLLDAIDAINNLPGDAFQNIHNRNALINKIMSLLVKYAQGTVDQEMVDKLRSDIGGKMNGCGDESGPDANDWIIDCTAQGDVYPLIGEAADQLENLLNR